jgi:hypothetical protein
MPAVPGAVLRALELAKEDLDRWCGGLTDEELNAQPAGLPAVAFQLRHVVRSLDRLLTYAEGPPLDRSQFAALKAELDLGATGDQLFTELRSSLERSAARIRTLSITALEESRTVGQKHLPRRWADCLSMLPITPNVMWVKPSRQPRSYWPIGSKPWSPLFFIRFAERGSIWLSYTPESGGPDA